MTLKKSSRRHRAQRFIAKYDDTYAHRSAALILAVGTFISIALLYFSSLGSGTIKFYQILNVFRATSNVFDSGYYSLLLLFYNLTVENNFLVFVSYLALGWLIAGAISGLLFGKLGGAGPRESLTIGFWFFMKLLMILVLIILLNLSYLNFENAFRVVIFLGLLAICILMILLIAPLSLVAFVGNRLGVMLRNV